MTATATYDGVLSRIQLSATLLGATATYAVVDRTIDAGITYTTVRGGTRLTVASQNAALDDFEFPPGVAITYRFRSYDVSNVLQSTQTVAITQNLMSVWLKVPSTPFLNQAVTVVDRGQITRKSRAGLFDVVGRSTPVMVGDVASSISYELQLLTKTVGAETNLDYLFASGEVVFLHLPSTVTSIPGGYFAVGDTSREPTMRLSPNRVWSVPLTGVAAPGPEVVGPAYTWTAVLADFATWTTELAANATWSALLARTGTPSDVIVS